MPYKRTSVGDVRGEAMELIDLSESLLPGEHKDLFIFKAFNFDEGSMETVRQAVTSSALAFAEALQDFFNDNTSWRTGLEDFHFKASGPSDGSHHPFWGY